MAHAGFRPDRCMPGDAEPFGQEVRRLEADAVDVESEAVRVIGNPNDRLITVGLVDAHRTKA